jgi:hypothetical protein
MNNTRVTNQLPGNGADYVTGTGANTGKWQAITALSATVIASATAGNVGGTAGVSRTPENAERSTLNF